MSISNGAAVCSYGCCLSCISQPPSISNYMCLWERFPYVLLDCVSTWAPVSLTQTLSLPLPLSFDVQHKRTASCGSLTARATRPYLCRAVSTAFLIQWSCLAGERQADTLDLTRSSCYKAALYSIPFNTISPGSCCLSDTTMLHLGL